MNDEQRNRETLELLLAGVVIIAATIFYVSCLTPVVQP